MLQPISNIKPVDPWEYDEDVIPTEYIPDYEYYSSVEEDCNDISDEEKAAWEDWSERMGVELPW